ncbi:MAG: LysE family transporter [Fervidicoccaceae archaeon]
MSHEKLLSHRGGLKLLDAVLQGIALGISLAAPPGPVNAIIASKSLRSWKRGASVGFGALTADLIFMIMSVYLGYLIPPKFMPAISLLGFAFLAWLAYGVLKSSASYTEKVKEKSGSSYFTGLAMGLTNPFQIMWWVTVGVSLVKSLGLQIFLGFVFGIASWVISFSYLINRFGFSRKFAVAIKWFSFITLSAFSIYLLYTAVTLLI